MMSPIPVLNTTHLSQPRIPNRSSSFLRIRSDGTVGANKNSVKIIGLETENYAQGYFVYDSKKAGAVTVSHLRFGPKPIHAPYLINRANFIACHQFPFLERFDMLKNAEEGSIFLLNSPYGADKTWEHLPKKVQEQIINKKLRFFVIDGYKVAQETGMGGRINTILQTCFFAISGVLPRDLAIQKIKESIEKTYGKRGEAVVKKTSPLSMLRWDTFMRLKFLLLLIANLKCVVPFLSKPLNSFRK